MPTHNTYRYTLGVAFDGVGDDTSETSGRAWAYGPAPSGSSNYEWLANHLVRLPESIDTGVNPLTADFNISSFDFEMPMNDAVALTFLYQSTDPQYKLGAALTAAGTSVTVYDLSGAAVTSLAGTAIWVGDECIKLGSHAGSGVYSSSTREFWNTSATAHTVDTFVHTAPNYWRHRGVRLIVHDRDTATERTLWRGWVDSMDTSNDGATLTIQCVEVLGSLRDAVVNRGVDVDKITPFGVLVPMAQTGGVRWFGTTDIPYTGRVRKATGTSYTSWLQVNDGLFRSTYTVATGTTRYGAVSASAVLGSLDDLDGTERVKKITEVFYVDSSRPAAQSSTGALTLPFHPLEIAMAFLTSTRSSTVTVGSESWDALNGNFALGISLDFFDTSAIASVISATRGVKVSRLLLGWDGEPVNVMEVIREKLLKPYGFYFAVTEEGLISFKRLELFNITDYSTAQNVDVSAYPTTLQWSAARSNAVQQVVAEVGGLPWRDPDINTVSGRDNTLTDSLRSGLFGELSTMSLDFSTQDNAESVEAILIDRLKYAYWAMPRLTITVGDSAVTGGNYDMGALMSPIIDTRDGWLVKNDGTRADGRGVLPAQVDSQFAGIIVGRTLNLDNMTYTITLLLTNYRQGGAAYLRAPSGVVTGQGGTNITIEANTFHASGNDSDRFTAGQAVYFTSPTGAVVETGFTINVVSTNQLTLSAAPTLVSVGDIVRLEDYDNKAGTDSFNYLADSNNTLGAAADNGRRWA